MTIKPNGWEDLKIMLDRADKILGKTDKDYVGEIGTLYKVAVNNTWKGFDDWKLRAILISGMAEFCAEQQAREFGADLSDIVEKTAWTIGDLIQSLLSQAILSAEKETVKRCIEALPKKIDCEEPTGEIPSDPGLAADQARNFTIDQATKALLSLPDQKELSKVKSK